VKACSPPEELQRQLASLADGPGVYLFKNVDKEVIYIGKALSLRNRVRSYWNTTSWRERPKLAVMIPKVSQVETILTNSEKEALILEATLVRQHMPRYNVHLKDDKRYPWLAITYDESFPRLVMVRDPLRLRKESPKAKVFGPYVEAGAMWETVRVLRKVFPMRQRKRPLFKDRPCMNYYIGLCMGPCQNLVQEPVYDRLVAQVEMFLAGRQNEVVAQLRKEMEDAAGRLEFELAAKIRDRLMALEKIIERQQVFFEDARISYDVVAGYHIDRLAAICLLRIREGKLISSETFALPLVEKTSPLEAFESFVDQYYTSCEDVNLPAELILQQEPEDIEVLRELLDTRTGHAVKIAVPRRGTKLGLVELAAKNARMALEKRVQEESSESQKLTAIVLRLQHELALKAPPRRIECFDISNIQGTDNVASLVVFENAQPKKSEYRQFKVKGVEGQANDFASMREVVGRRYRRLLEELKPLPDLIVIDGGKGQLNAALAALSELKLDGPDIIGLAKKQEEVYVPGRQEPLLLPRRSEALHLLQRARDEAHRFALTLHRKLRAKRSLVSELDGMPGLGKARRKRLIDHFGSVDQIKQATLEELKAVPGVPASLAEAIYASYHGQAEAS